MRNSLFVLALFVPALTHAQTFERIEVVKVDSTRTAQDIYRVAERWFVDTFKDAQEVIQLRDTVTSTIVGKGMSHLNYSCGSGMWASTGFMRMVYSVEVQAKKGRFRIRIYDVSIGASPNAAQWESPYRNDTCCYMVCDTTPMPKSGMNRKAREVGDQLRRQVCSGASTTVEGLIVSLKSAMLKPKDDW